MVESTKKQAHEKENHVLEAATRVIRSFFHILWRLFCYWLVLVVVLSGLYWFIPPISTLMIGDWMTGKAVVREYVSLEEISPHLSRAVITAEDASFCNHSGIDWRALTGVVDNALKRGPSRGASTITMQTAKNLFLLPNRSYIRKALEIPLALYIEVIWSKRHLLEIYLNVAEWGDGIYGAEAAARHHFGKSARALSQQEAALLATALPNPILRKAGQPATYHRILAAQLIRRMNTEGLVIGCLK